VRQRPGVCGEQRRVHGGERLLVSGGRREQGDRVKHRLVQTDASRQFVDQRRKTRSREPPGRVPMRDGRAMPGEFERCLAAGRCEPDGRRAHESAATLAMVLKAGAVVLREGA
jgi:hypothetical protein